MPPASPKTQWHSLKVIVLLNKVRGEARVCSKAKGPGFGSLQSLEDRRVGPAVAKDNVLGLRHRHTRMKRQVVSKSLKQPTFLSGFCNKVRCPTLVCRITFVGYGVIRESTIASPQHTRMQL